jgi:hypothetical protein
VLKLQHGRLSAQVLGRRANAITDHFLNLLLFCPPRALLSNNPSLETMAAAPVQHLLKYSQQLLHGLT